MESRRRSTDTLSGILLLPTVVALACAPARPAAEPFQRGRVLVVAPLPSPMDAARRERIEMGDADQAYRDYDRVMGMLDTEREEFMARAAAADRRHAIRLAAIVRRYGWPDRDRFGPDASRAAFLIVQHADHDPGFQARMLPLLEAAAHRGTIEPSRVAFLTDRVRVSQGKPQGERYGWPLRVIEDAADDPARDRPDAFVEALRSALAASRGRRDQAEAVLGNVQR